MTVITSAPLETLDYGRPSTRQAHTASRALYTALCCGLGPTCLGTVALTGWLVTHYDGFALLGVFAIVAGVALLPVGLLAAGWYLWSCHRAKRTPVRRWLLPGVAAVAILAGNLPLSAAYVAIHDSVANRYTVRVVNSTPAAITKVLVTDPRGQTLVLGPIAPGQMVEKSFRPTGEGAITMTATASAQQWSGTVDGYISGGTPGMRPVTRTLTINADGSFTAN